MSIQLSSIRFDMAALMHKTEASTARELGQLCGLTSKSVHNRLVRGIGWAEADDLAIRAGFMPWEVWPEWADVDFSDWIEPACPAHDVFDPPDGTTVWCVACTEAGQLAA